MENIKKYAVIVAGGKGTRMGSQIPKQFLPLLGIPLMCHSIQSFAAAFPDIQIVLVVPEIQLGSAQTVLRSYIGRINVLTVAGGETRFHSVKNGLKHVTEESIVFVHDGARPLISRELIMRCYRQAHDKGSAIPSLPMNESVRMLVGHGSVALDRDNLQIIQTPQTFRSELLLPAFEQKYIPSFTDEATVVEAYGLPVHLIPGVPGNIKVTRPDDLVIAEALLHLQH